MAPEQRSRTIGGLMEHERPTEPGTTPPAPSELSRHRWTVGAVVAVVLAVVLTIVVAGGGDDSPDTDLGATASTAPDTSTPGDGSTEATTAGSSTVTDPDGTLVDSTQPGETTVPTQTTLVGATSVPGVTVPFTPGSLDTVPVETVVTAPPVGIDEVADTGTGMTFRLEQLEAVDGEANGPGEIAGPAVRVTVVATNDSPSPVLLESIVVDLTYGAQNTSAAPLSGPGALRFSGEVAPGASATGVYVFEVPVDQRGAVSVLVSYAASVSPVVFQGEAPKP
jgi:hypothetical protein